MFVRQKPRPQHTTEDMRIAVQIVDGQRMGNVVRQQVLHHVGVARDEAELERLVDMGEAIKLVLERDAGQSLFGPGDLPPATPKATSQKVDMNRLRHERSVVTGIHEVFGPVYQWLGLHQILPRSRYRVSHRTLFDTVMGRLGNPASKRATANYVAAELGSPLALHAIYRMMDHLTPARIEQLQSSVAQATCELLPEPVRVIFFDCTTLYFESVDDSDDFRTFGYSKDGKAKRVQVVLALAVTADGMPLNYALYRGREAEGATLQAFVEKMRTQHAGTTNVVVADAGLLSRKNLQMMESADLQYVTGARLKSLTRTQTEALHAHPWETAPEAEWSLGDGRRLVVWYSPRRARRDMHLRNRMLKRLQKRLAQSTSPKTWLANHKGAARVLRLDGDATLTLDEDAIAALAKWDGLVGVVTNTDLSVDELRTHYHGLWQVERGFRVTKHELAVRPMFHWTEQRIRAHVAICYMAYACLRQVEKRLRDMGMPLSPERILKAARSIKDLIVWEQGKPQRYAIPATLDEDAKTLLKALKIRRTSKPQRLA